MDLEDRLKSGEDATGWKILFDSVPFYVTNKTADGFIMSFSTSFIFTLLIIALGVFNAIGWGIYGLVQLADKMI